MNRRVDLQRKLAKKLVELASVLNATIILEKIPNNFNQRIVKRRNKAEKMLRNTLHNIGISGLF